MIYYIPYSLSPTHEHNIAGGEDRELFQRFYEIERERLRERRAQWPYVVVRTRLGDDLLYHWIHSTLRALNIQEGSDIENTTTPSNSTASKSNAVGLTPPVPSPPLQLVMLGSGFDCRAYRLPFLKHCTVFELDQVWYLSNQPFVSILLISINLFGFLSARPCFNLNTSIVYCS